MTFLDRIVTSVFDGVEYLLDASFYLFNKSMFGVLNAFEYLLDASFYLFDKSMKGIFNGFEYFLDFVPTIPSRIKNKICSYWPFVHLLNQDEKNSHLWDAISNDNTSKLQTFIHAGADITMTREGLNTLMRAVTNGHTQSVAILIKAGALPTVEALHYAYTMTEQLLKSLSPEIKAYSEITQLLLKSLSPEIIEAEFNHENTNPGLKKLIQMRLIEKINYELLIISNNKKHSPFNRLPAEILTLILSKNHPILTSKEILPAVNLFFKSIYETNEAPVIKEPILPAANSVPVIFSVTPSTNIPIENKPLVKIDNDAEIGKKPISSIDIN